MQHGEQMARLCKTKTSTEYCSHVITTIKHNFYAKQTLVLQNVLNAQAHLREHHVIQYKHFTTNQKSDCGILEPFVKPLFSHKISAISHHLYRCFFVSHQLSKCFSVTLGEVH